MCDEAGFTAQELLEEAPEVWFAVCGNWRAVRCRCLEHASGSAGVRVLASAARMCAADIVCVSASARTRAKNTAVDQARMGPELERHSESPARALPYDN